MANPHAKSDYRLAGKFLSVVAAGTSMRTKMFAFALVILALPLRAPAQPAAADITGTFNGSYDGPQGTVSFTLSVTEQERRGAIAGVLTSHPAGSSDTAASTNELGGFYNPPTHRFQLRPNVAKTARPGNRDMLVINGTYDPNSGQLSGMMLMGRGGAIKFAATRSGTEPARTAAAPAETPSAAPTQTTSTLDGIYNGTYTGGAGPRTLKLALRTFEHGTLAGIFTFYEPPTSHDHAHSFSMTGKFEPATGKFTLEPAKWLTPAPGYFMVGIAGTFNASAGKVAGILTAGRHGPFEAARDAAESADIAKLIPAPAGPAAAATEMAGQPPEIKQPTADNVSGVYTGFCGCVSGKVNARLSLKATDISSVTGLLTLELPPDVGSPATFKLTGSWHLGVVRVDAMPLGPPAPFNWAVRSLLVRNTEGMGTIATHLRGDVVNRSSCDIEVFRDETESARLDAAMAEQSEQATSEATLAKAAAHAKELQEAHQAATKAQANVIKTAAPAQLASKDLVRKSQKYWDAYHEDLIREIFDGGFGSGIGNNTQFELLFTHYVEAFGRDCKAALPAKHETVTITEYKIEKDAFGNIVRSQTVKTWSVEVDSRFAPFYRDYYKELKRRSPAMAIGVAAGHGSMRDLLDPVEDIERFFGNHKCQSAAMRQFTENLLRAAEDKLSLQQAGEKIAGAAAETDPDVPPGRYVRFVDGCNGWSRDPANARYQTGQSGAWCQCMGDKYQHIMSRDEEYYYANDFGRRFRDNIAQPHSTDPAWNRLHPAVEDCRQ